MFRNKSKYKLPFKKLKYKNQEPLTYPHLEKKNLLTVSEILPVYYRTISAGVKVAQGSNLTPYLWNMAYDTSCTWQ